MTPATPAGRQSVIRWPPASAVLSRAWVCGIFATSFGTRAEVAGFCLAHNNGKMFLTKKGPEWG